MIGLSFEVLITYNLYWACTLGAEWTLIDYIILYKWFEIKYVVKTTSREQ